MSLHDRLVLLWVRLTVCLVHGHDPWSSEPTDYCRDCGAPNDRRAR